jgi:UDP-N-acetylglucosamine--N-acetylmuramyl-(pentapeptide) pyrophosphoryl-undecaprenol N-acetylglucosamine transferase
MTPFARPKILMAASPGGHLAVLDALRPAVQGRETVWVTAPSRTAAALEESGEEVRLLPLYGRNPVRLVGNLFRAVRILARERPALVVTSGAGLVVPLCLAARTLGIRIVFAETMARVTGPSLSGRVLGRLASAVLVQWPELQKWSPRAVLCRPALLEDLPTGVPDRGCGTFVAVGTHSEGFDRLLRAVDDAVAAELLPGPVSAQSGPSSYRPRNYTARPWMSPAEVEEAIASSRRVVCHAGSGVVAAALRAGRRPLVMPRLRRHGEHVDDHQEQLATKLHELGLAVRVNGRIDEDDVAACAAPLYAPDFGELSAPMVAVLEAEVTRLHGSAL